MSIDLIKTGFVSIIGLPNAGKSSFLNTVIKDNIAITSRKPQTTRKNLKGIYNDKESQIVFVDTPGIHSGKNKLDDYMSKSINKSMEEIDLLIVIVDIITYEKDDYNKIQKLIANKNTKKVLIINKVDVLLSKNDLKSEYDNLIDHNITNENINKINENQNIIISKFNDLDISFDKIFLISSLKKLGIESVIEYIKDNLPEGHRFYDDTDLTDVPTKQIVADMIRQQCLYKLDKEIPHGIVVIVDSMKESRSKCVKINAMIICEKDNHKGIIIGKNGSMIKNIGTASRIAIEKFLSKKVNLDLNVIVKKNWKDESTLLVNYGFDIKKI